MADLLELFGTDTKLAEEGVWHTLGDGFRVRIARWNNPAFQRALEDEMERVADIRDDGGLSEEQDRQIMARVMAGTIVTDWEGAEYEGQPLEFTPDNVERVLADPRMRDLRLAISQRAQQADRYRIKRAQADAKNSSKRSAGS